LHQLLYQWQTGQLSGFGLGNWSYLLIVLAVVFEGPVATLFSATAVSSGLLNPVPVFLAVVAGNLIGDTFWYSMGRLGNPDWFSRYGRRLGVTPQRLEQFQDAVQQRAPKFVFLTKLMSSLIIPTLIATGLSRVPWRRWVPSLIAAEAVKSTCLLLIGYFFGSTIMQFEGAFKFAPLVAVLLFLLLILLPRLLHVMMPAEISSL
jgi:membrane protein DedA with SNARE-associated domain